MEVRRNTTVALIYWCALHLALFSAGRALDYDRRLFYACGAAYVLLLWSPLAIVRLIERRPLRSLGFQTVSLPRALGWGLGAFGLILVFLTVENWFRLFCLGQPLEPGTPLISKLPREVLEQLLWIGLPEEIAHRGYFLTRLRESWGAVPALFMSAFLFGLGHLALGDAPRAIQAGVSGLVYGALFLRTESVYVPASVHIAVNLFGGATVRRVVSLMV